MSKSGSETSRAPDSAAREETEPTESGATLVELILSEGTAPPLPARIDGVMVGSLAGFGEGGEPLVAIPGANGPRPARAAVSLTEGDIGRAVAMLFEGGSPERPIVMGLMHEPSPIPEATTLGPSEGEAARPKAGPPPMDVDVDGKRMTFTAEEEIVLQCGKASITLTRAGKIIIRGAYVLTRSSGVNRILGGSVQIN